MAPVVARDGTMVVALMGKRGSRLSQYIGIWTKAQPRWRFTRLHSGQVAETSVSLHILSATRSFAVFGHPTAPDGNLDGQGRVSPLYVTNNGWRTCVDGLTV